MDMVQQVSCTDLCRNIRFLLVKKFVPLALLFVHLLPLDSVCATFSYARDKSPSGILLRMGCRLLNGTQPDANKSSPCPSVPSSLAQHSKHQKSKDLLSMPNRRNLGRRKTREDDQRPKQVSWLKTTIRNHQKAGCKEGHGLRAKVHMESGWAGRIRSFVLSSKVFRVNWYASMVFREAPSCPSDRVGWMSPPSSGSAVRIVAVRTSNTLEVMSQLKQSQSESRICCRVGFPVA